VSHPEEQRKLRRVTNKKAEQGARLFLPGLVITIGTTPDSLTAIHFATVWRLEQFKGYVFSHHTSAGAMIHSEQYFGRI
jgi:hypothetical protein